MKRVLNAGNHPVFVGRQMFAAAARNGGAFVVEYGGADVATALVNPRLNSLLVLNVCPEHRGHALGAAIVRYLQCNFARVIESAVPFFVLCGYEQLGEFKQGNRYRTAMMIRSKLRLLAGRISTIFAA